jgi:hypothetical protein
MMTFLNASTSTAIGINSFGQIIGNQGLWTPSSSNGTAGMLMSSNSGSGPLDAINDNGQTISNYEYNLIHPPALVNNINLFTPSSPHGSTGATTTFSTSAGDVTCGLAINASGMMLTGLMSLTTSPPSCQIAANRQLWTINSAGAVVSQTTLPGQPAALNNAGQVVAASSYFYSGGKIYDLSLIPNWPAGGVPAGISDYGQIVVNANGSVYLLTPDTPTPPMPVAASPQTGSGSVQAMSFTFNDPRGWQDLGVVNILINNSIDGRNACYLAYSVPTNTLYLVADDPSTAQNLYAGALTLGSSNTIQNSQCSVGLISAKTTGNTLVLSLALVFKPAFVGNRVVYLAAGDALQRSNSGWMPLGVWQVPGSAPTSTTAVTGMSASDNASAGFRSYTFTFSDTKGNQDLGVENILINTALDGGHACYIAYDRQSNFLYLVNDNGDALLPGINVANGGSVFNNQCWVAVDFTSAISTNGNTLSLTVSINFRQGFGPNLVFYLAARDSPGSNNTGWQAIGTLTVQ